MLVGLLPGCAILSLTNHWKFGTWHPFSYGPWQATGSSTRAAEYVTLAVFSIVAFVAAHFVSPFVRRPARHQMIATGLAFGGLTLFVPALRRALLQTLEGLWMLLVDLRIRDLGWLEPGLTRSPGGGMVYIRTLKTSLLQSCPYLPIAFVALLTRAGSAHRTRRKMAVAFPVLVYLAVFSYFRWHGGLSVNLRYFVPTLPFLAILAAEGLVWLRGVSSPVLHGGRASLVIVPSATGIYVAALVFLHPPTASWSVREAFYLDVPLVIAAAIAVASTAGALFVRVRACAAAAALTFTVAGLVWGGLTEFTYDAAAVIRTRMYGRVVAKLSRPFIPRGSLVVVDYADRAALLIEDDVVIAHGSRDDFQDAPRLISAMTCNGHPAFAVMRCRAWEQVGPRLTARAVTFDVLLESRSEDLVVAALHGPCQ